MERLGVHLDGKEIYDIVITDSFDGLEEEAVSYTHLTLPTK